MCAYDIFLIFVRLSSDPINICSGLVLCKLSLFASNRLFIFDNSVFVALTISFSDFPVVVRLVSSAYILAVEVRKLFGISFIYIMNSKGPRMDPCGTPHIKVLGEDSSPLTWHF